MKSASLTPVLTSTGLATRCVEIRARMLAKIAAIEAQASSRKFTTGVATALEDEGLMPNEARRMEKRSRDSESGRVRVL